MTISVKTAKEKSPAVDATDPYAPKPAKERSGLPFVIGTAIVSIALYIKTMAVSVAQTFQDEPNPHPERERPIPDAASDDDVVAESGGNSGNIARTTPPKPAEEAPVREQLVTLGRSSSLTPYKPPAYSDGGNVVSLFPASSRPIEQPSSPMPVSFAGSNYVGNLNLPKSETEAAAIHGTADEVKPPVPQTANRAPVKSRSVYLADLKAGDALLISVASLLVFADDADGDVLKVSNLQVSSGALKATQDGYIYTPDPKLIGPVQISYDISDGKLTIPQVAHFNVQLRSLNGTDSGDSIVGTDFADEITGQAGDDSIEAGFSSDVVAGGGGDDLIGGGAGADILFGGLGNDTIYGDDGDDTVNGDDGDDVLYGGKGEDIVAGGNGDDRLEGDAGDDQLLGDAGKDLLSGGGGEDLLDGGAGADVLAGGSGGDRARGDDGDDRLLGEAGDDALSGGRGADALFGGTGEDDILGGSGDDSLQGDEGDDHLAGEAGDDLLAGGNGEDVAYGGTGSDVLIAGNGADQLFGGGGEDSLQGDAGNDWLFGGADDDLLLDSTGSDAIFGGSGSDLVVAELDGFDDLLSGDNSNDDAVVSFADDIAPPESLVVLVNLSDVEVFDLSTISDDGTEDVSISVTASLPEEAEESETQVVLVNLDDVDILDYSAATFSLEINLAQGFVEGDEVGHDSFSGFELVIGGQSDDIFIVGGGDVAMSGGNGDDRFNFVQMQIEQSASISTYQILDFNPGDVVETRRYNFFERDEPDEHDDLSEPDQHVAVSGILSRVRINYVANGEHGRTVVELDDDEDQVATIVTIDGHHVLMFCEIT